ncbi:bifunctional MaoC family dehydratase N-terminal/OB-fold nucleic acid binding domain-containing protein [Streptomyces yaizuensis]|uniref:Bifunctional MaoC family dehydratase/OB-fold nucleic acid binding domain-containing protein n=1 Tax=Streptomyces yaizuensis TaxID=2989713 RepID=A0ABQ5NZK4_9ACTN|nr:OB-fold domain-containing protein [Streptomyces sp. YSPA8]GLF95794.1 bifunctional MaoC family dehydratase/OB-fold nucleic acid binding domain-containing protein [Streptomyces sp. YSPA8]
MSVPDPDLLYERLRAYEGVVAVTGVGRDLVNEPMIRHWCEAVGDRNPAYQGPGAVAPPTMLQVWTMGGLSGHPGRSPAYGELLALLEGAGCTGVLATDSEQEYGRPLRPGERITYETVIESVSERKRTRLGAGYFITTRMDVRADGEPAGTHRFRVLRYVPARAEGGVAGGAGAARAEGGVAGGAGAAVRPRRPRPVVNRDTEGFWRGVAEHRLLIQRCRACRTLRFPWLPGCNGCGSQEWDTVEARGSGTVFSWVVMHHPPFPAFAPDGEPYAVALVELAEGVRIVSNVTGVPCGEVRIGMAVELEFFRADAELELPVFRAVAGSEG